jgi:hypothetical protein
MMRCRKCDITLHTPTERYEGLCAICGLQRLLDYGRERQAREREAVRWCAHGYLRDFCEECRKETRR